MMLEEYPEDKFTFVRFDIHKFQLINLFGPNEGDRLIKYIADILSKDASEGQFDYIWKN